MYDYQSTYLANLILRYFHCLFLGPITAKPEGGKLVRMQMKSMDIPRWNVVSEPDPQSKGGSWYISWDGSVHCTRYAGTLPIGF